MGHHFITDSAETTFLKGTGCKNQIRHYGILKLPSHTPQQINVCSRDACCRRLGAHASIYSLPYLEKQCSSFHLHWQGKGRMCQTPYQTQKLQEGLIKL